MPPVGFDPTISAAERPHTYVLDRAATGTGSLCFKVGKYKRNTEQSPKADDKKL